MKIKVLGDIYDEETGNKRFTVKVGDEIFKDIKVVKPQIEKCRKCKHYPYGCNRDNVVRTFDCEKKSGILQGIFNTFTSFGVIFAVWYIFAKLGYGVFTKIAILVLSLVGFDMICTFIEEIVTKIYDWFFYRRLIKIKKKNEKLEEEARKAEEEKKQKEEAEKIANAPYYQKVIAAKTIVQRLKELSEYHHYGPNEEKIDVCVEKCEAILQKLQEDSSGYIRVIYLFEAYLPEFCETLELYTNFVKADAVTEENEKILTDCVDVILQFLESQRIKAFFDKVSVETQFQASAATLRDMLEEEIKE